MGGKRQTVNYFVHITHVPQLRQEHLVTVPEITVPQWRTRKVRQMEGQMRKSRAASHPFSRAVFFLSFLTMMVGDNENYYPLRPVEICLCGTDVTKQKARRTCGFSIQREKASLSNAEPVLKWRRATSHNHQGRVGPRPFNAS